MTEGANRVCPEDKVTVSKEPTGDPPEETPPRLVGRAKALFSQRSQGDLAVLAFDSLLDCDDSPEDHRLRFEHPRMSIEVQVAATPSDASLHGHCLPPSASSVELEAHQGERVRLEKTPGGDFSVSGIPHGIVRLHFVDSSADPPIHTDWFRV